MMHVLITGAAGFIGSHACRACLGRGWRVTGIDNFDPFYDRAIKEQAIAGLHEESGFRFVEGDIRDGTAVCGALEGTGTGAGAGVDVVLHLAARAGVRPSIEDPDGYVSVNVCGTATLLESCNKAGVKRFVFGSSSSVYGDSTPVPFSEDAEAMDPISPYAATKRAAELHCKVYTHLHDFRIAALRFFTVYGPRQRPDLAIHKFARLMSTGAPIVQFGDGSSERDYTHIEDILQGTLAAIDWVMEDAPAFELFNLGESKTVRLSYLIELIAGALRVEPKVEIRPAAPGDVRRTCADITKARRVLGYDPSMSIEEGIRRFVTWYNATYGCPA
ncbi:MAG: GDP-mannose 4,6-dehydratase [Gemmatimonadetes bacterium]|nr:GDP-mannose 4,6-dehydratase [Gemmatimonadota bacterium]